MAGPTLLTGCGARTDKTLTFWQFYAPVTQDDPTLQKQSKWFERLVEQWNDEHDVKDDADYNYVLAAATVAAMPTLLLFFVFQRQIIESVKTSGLK